MNLKVISTLLSMFLYKIGLDTLLRTTAVVMYPIAYVFRWEIRRRLYSNHKLLFEERVWKDTQDESIPRFNAIEKITFVFWRYLDDSPAKDSITNINEHSYNDSNSWDSSDTRRYYPSEWIYNNRTLRDIWFSFIRNNSVNHFSWYRTGGWTDEINVVAGSYDKEINISDRADDGTHTYYYPGWYLVNVKHKNGKVYPYYTYVGVLFGRKVGMWFGRSPGSGRQSFSLRA